MDPISEAPAGVAFGRFLLSPHRRELLADGRPVRLGGRAFDVLLALIDARGAVVCSALTEIKAGRAIAERLSAHT
jgi:hypothetical protein